MIKTDCHLHSSISSDSDTPMEDMVLAAIHAGLDTIAFTEHMDYDFPDTYGPDFIFNPDEYFDKTETMRAAYGGRINILDGVELGLKPFYTENYNKLLNEYEWDFVIGSTHLVDDIDPYYSEYWNNDESACIKRYFEIVYENIKAYDNFDSLGHLDYILRYSPYEPSSYRYEDFSPIIDDILKYIIRHDIALEINTSGYKKLNAPNPSPEIIKRYTGLGGRLVTIGSDAHSPEYAGFRYDSLAGLLSGLGIYEYAVYKKRCPVMVPL